MLAAPVCNPVVIAATLVAFQGDIALAAARTGAGIVVALTVGAAMGMVFRNRPVTEGGQKAHAHSCSCSHCHEHIDKTATGFFTKLIRLAGSAGFETLHVLPYVIAGSLLASLLQALVPVTAITEHFVLGRVFIQIAVMMLFGFLLSLCSTSDAFIARSMNAYFKPAALMGFLLLGPMIDIKNIVILRSYFSRRFVWLLFGLTSISVMMVSLLYALVRG